MKFQFRRFIANVPWEDWAVVLGALLTVTVLLYVADQRAKSKERRCPTCNQVIREATK